MPSLAFHALLSIAAAGAPTGTVEVLGAPAAFALEEGFVEVLPDTPLVVIARDVADDEELVVELVRIGMLGKGRAKATVVAGKLKRALAVLAPTLKDRKLGGAYASTPVRQRAPLPSGTTRVEIRVDAPMAVRVSVDKKAALEPLALVPLAPPPTPTPAAPAPAPVAPAVAVAPVATATPVVTEPAPVVAPTRAAAAPVEPVVNQPAAPASEIPPWLPRLLAEVHAGTSLVFGGLQTFVPSGGARVLLGPRDLDAALGFAVDFDGQSTFVDVTTPDGASDTSGSWTTTSTRVRLEGHLGIGDLAAFEARLGLTVGAGARFAWHTAALPGVQRELFVVGATARVAPEASFPAGPGRFAIALPLDGTIDVSPDVQGFAPVAVGVFLGYRLDL